MQFHSLSRSEKQLALMPQPSYCALETSCCSCVALEVSSWGHISVYFCKVPKGTLYFFFEQGDSITVESLQASYTERTGDVSWRHLFMRVAYLQDEMQLSRVSPEEFVFVRQEQRLPITLLVGNPHKQVASQNVSHFRWEWFHRYRWVTSFLRHSTWSCPHYATQLLEVEGK